MEQNTVELLDEVEKDIVNEAPETQLKEYEKLLIAERDRKDYEKAKDLLSFGCFDQNQESTIDFNELEAVEMPRKYKGLYSLYRNKETLQLFFICPLVEDNKGDENERTDLKPYAYDVIALEEMDNETYLMVCKAAKNNLKSSVRFAYKASFVLYFVHLVLSLSMFVYNLIMQSSNGLVNAIFSSLFYSATYFLGLIVATPLIVLMMIKYKKYKEQ